MNKGLPIGLAVALAVAAMTAHSADGANRRYQAPRLADGTPDLQGVWTNQTATPMERAVELGTRRAFTDAEAAAISKAAIAAVEADAQPSDPDKKIEAAASLPPVGNYNLFWTDRGMSVAQIDGEYRTSMIIEPLNGRVPPLTEAARKRMDATKIGRSNDGPEGRALGERCLLSFGYSSGPPMLPVMYNSYYQIVQSPGYVMILVEMVHDARIIRIDDEHVPGSVRKWMGDSVGRWEGDTLVVQTRNFRQEQSFRGSSEQAVITERFTRVADDKIVYRFTVDDPATFTERITGELPFVPADGNVYEYACHEGNYALPGILSGAREEEKAAAAK
ncbi:hypothetical protein GCM10011487_37130 [Steroidobacter agaridevorans]|uniref:Uncharacterized protein n=1 Tax=Steroidobacter agaridevorans TaxID=2695856 RepID=A0A829YFL9_9GAMM|nr:hypothetical protein [Steroidobacter agaridevorans]GFE81713.1 hypothetical protein GCM10011487_37130 [Steroidobacter agaridevorans]